MYISEVGRKIDPVETFSSANWVMNEWMQGVRIGLVSVTVIFLLFIVCFMYNMFHLWILVFTRPSIYLSFLSFSCSLLYVMSSLFYKKAFQKPFGSLNQFR